MTTRSLSGFPWSYLVAPLVALLLALWSAHASARAARRELERRRLAASSREVASHGA